MTIVPTESIKESKIHLEQFDKTRAQTLELVQPLEKEDYVVQTAFFMSPPKWHLGHVSWFYEVVMSKIDPNYKFFSKQYSKIFNSYYQSMGQPHDKAKRGILSRPTVDETMEYFFTINKKVEDFLSKIDSEKDFELFKLAFNHEYQHQELLVYDIQHLLAGAYNPVKRNNPPKPSPVEKKSIKIEGGLFVVGYSGSEFSYDIERPEHKMYLNTYLVDAFPITNGEYMKFIEDGGYKNFRFWLADGWEAVKKNDWNAPMYWERDESGIWIRHDYRGRQKINPKEPVCNVSYYEADAYCKWAGKRLPTEAEWEKAASWNEEKKIKTIYPWGNEPPTERHANLLESYLWSQTEIGSYPEGKSHYGCHQMMGDVWEWTSSDFVGYPGFMSDFVEYNDKWFCNQKVLRGSSFATQRLSIRNSYRNFFRPEERWMFAGFRCVQDV
ncbi:MAG: ergothioneine biosynthesis protein EgtB [Thaumarchaeota archaeon]|nr:ergothioneine biosynthesis protein EgtB [Nitrososphaerota archaeon]MDE1832144.1 ergothioneine biosynthesis protein EgtB [Nitrososphaerota archaeon]MDE1841597.1 ergothioneine biosynthesis protein EgtB [Nitrososphaerota archaeon]